MIVAGSANMDIVVRTPRAPAAGETLMGLDYTLHPGGKGANQAVAARRAGASVHFAGCLGTDPYGDTLAQTLAAEAIDLATVTRTPTATGIALITVEANGENRIIVIAGANQTFRGDLPTPLNPTTILLTQLEIPLQAVLTAAQKIRQAGGTVILNASPIDHIPPPDRAALLALTDILLVNQTEAASLLGTPTTTADAAAKLAQGRRAAIVTLGAAGAVWSAAGTTSHCPGHAITPIDTTGCGDAFAGAFAAAIERGAAIAEAVRFGNAAGALAATKAGAQPAMPTASAITDFLARTT